MTEGKQYFRQRLTGHQLATKRGNGEMKLLQMRAILAEELDRGGQSAAAMKVRASHDNNAESNAAMRAMLRVAELLGNDRSAARERVYFAIDTERNYQERKRDSHGLKSQVHELAAFLTYMDDYLSEAKSVLSRDWTPAAYPRTLDIVRKVVALGVAAMEHHGAPPRL